MQHSGRIEAKLSPRRFIRLENGRNEYRITLHDTTKTSFQQERLQRVGGVDISFVESTNTAVACLVVLRYPVDHKTKRGLPCFDQDLEVVYEDFQTVQLTTPYVPGFLAFREAVPFMNLIRRVVTTEFNPQVHLQNLSL